ncbi:Cys-tRNA(Pro)/Cys-tRNA(Cys) deacylase YbaK [Escherichia coli]|nr:Cys-tRNA(Pro)/Cys-tRNA(Cys) deacylase YbaK [Escherichia coli]
MKSSKIEFESDQVYKTLLVAVNGDMKHLAVRYAGRRSTGSKSKSAGARKLRWPIRWSQRSTDTGWGITGAEKRLPTIIDAPHKNLPLFMFPAASADWISNWAAGDLAKILDAKFADIARREALCRMQTSGTFGLLPAHLTFRFINTHIQRRAFLDIRFQHFGINKAGIHIARFVIKARISIPPVALKFNVAIR